MKEKFKRLARGKRSRSRPSRDVRPLSERTICRTSVPDILELRDEAVSDLIVAARNGTTSPGGGRAREGEPCGSAGSGRRLDAGTPERTGDEEGEGEGACCFGLRCCWGEEEDGKAFVFAGLREEGKAGGSW